MTSVVWTVVELRSTRWLSRRSLGTRSAQAVVGMPRAARGAGTPGSCLFVFLCAHMCVCSPAGVLCGSVCVRLICVCTHVV